MKPWAAALALAVSLVSAGHAGWFARDALQRWRDR